MGTRVLNDLVSWRPYALTLSRDFFFPGADREDVEQEAMIGLWEALERWDPERGPLKNYISLIVRRRLMEKVTLALRVKHRFLTESVRVFEHDEEDVGFIEIIPDPIADPIAVVIARERLAEIIRIVSQELSPTERRAVIGFANGLPYDQIGPAKQIDNALCRARRKLAA